MESNKMGLLTQLAILADYIDKIEISSKNKKIIFDLEQKEFDRIKNVIEQKINFKTKINKNFNLDIDGVNYTFNLV